MRVVESIDAWGHPNITAKNRTTFEVTRDKNLSQRGNCIIAINASKGARDLKEKFKNIARSEDAKISVIIEVGTLREMITGRGDQNLTFNHPTDLVARKSTYICDRTLMLGADKAARDLPRDLIKEAQSPFKRVKITLIVEI